MGERGGWGEGGWEGGDGGEGEGGDGGGEGALMLTMSRVNPMQSPSASDMGEEPEVRPHAPCPHGSGWAGLCGH